MHINHRRTNRQEYPYSDAVYNRVQQDARNKRQRRMGKVAARLGLRAWDERNVLDPDVPLVTLRREGK